MRIMLNAGDSLDIVMPSGQVINVEVTQDTASVCNGEFSLWGEELDVDRPAFSKDASWKTRWPESIKQGLEDQRHDDTMKDMAEAAAADGDGPTQYT